MCRHLAYVGPDLAPRTLLLDAPHSLAHQSYAARELLMGTVAADGFGFSWYRDEAGPLPALYRSVAPIWSDRDLPTIARSVRAHALVANVRNATEAGTNDHANVHPFDEGVYTFSHNGYLEDFRGRWMRSLRATLSERHEAAIRGTTDSETIFRCLLTRLDEGSSVPEALAAVVEHLVAAAEGRGHARLNFLLSDGVTVWATRAGTHPTNSLYTLVDGARAPGGTVIASEPLDEDPKWRPVAQDHLVVARAGEPVVSKAL